MAKTYDIYPFISFNSRVVSAKWHEERAKWQLEVASVLDDSKPETFEGDVFINAGGVLNDWKWPDIEGLENFQGNLIHTAAWVSVWSMRTRTNRNQIFLHVRADILTV